MLFRSATAIFFVLSVGACSDGEGAPSREVVVRGGAPIEAPVSASPSQEVEGGLDDGRSDEPAFQRPDRDRRAEALEELAMGLQGLDSQELTVIDRTPEVPTGGGVTALSWRDISLRPLYGKKLRTILYPEDFEERERAELPAEVTAWSGREVAILGYMIPLEWGEATVPQFMLVRDLMACCFGGTPMADEWIDVTMTGEGAEYFAYEPVVVTGTLRVGAFMDQWGIAAGCFRIEGEAVEAQD